MGGFTRSRPSSGWSPWRCLWAEKASPASPDSGGNMAPHSRTPSGSNAAKRPRFPRSPAPCGGSTPTSSKRFSRDGFKAAWTPRRSSKSPLMARRYAAVGMVKSPVNTWWQLMPQSQHLVAAYAPKVRAVLAQIRVDAKTNEHKAALELLGILSVKGNVVVGDAMFCQRDVAEAVVDSGGDSVFTVKDNQPGRKADIQAAFGFEAAARRIAAATSPSRPPHTRTGSRGDHDRQSARSDRATNAPHDTAADLG